MATQETILSTSWAQPGPIPSAVQHIRKMRGGSQSHLLAGSDGNLYVTKFQNNPQHVRVLANEFLATRLAFFLGLPMPTVEVIAVPEWFIADNPGLQIETADRLTPCASGLQLGVRYAADLWQDRVFDHLSKAMFERVINGPDFGRILVLDKWLGNCDGRQAVFTRPLNCVTYHATFIDQGYCFNAGEWTFPDLPLLGTYYHNHVYNEVCGWDSFEPILESVENFDFGSLWRFASEIPLEWYHHDQDALSRLIETLYERRSTIRDLITSFRNCSRNPFPNWTANVFCCG